ncbi:trypsin-like serine peptidase [Nonomuraea sediminis]|uniref:trypsin-like serine peptidase n=1 Tax=Nonomuraea sediminis TaxID=2835864 RepID=UPI00202A0613|nr:hypothetical protein [Nonomuraea sediminis]
MNATPYSVQTVITDGALPSGGIVPDGKPTSVPPLAPPASRLANDKTPATTGKVFFVGADGQPHWCTGTAVQSAYRNLVATAGHCVYDTQSALTTLDKWVFVPGYADGTTPSGLYVGKQVFTHFDFASYEDYDRDYAFVNVYNGVVSAPSGGLTNLGRLGDSVGGQGVAYNQPLSTPVDVFGYPAGTPPYTGEKIESFKGETFSVKIPSLKIEEGIGVDSRVPGEGSLGSSWLVSYSDGARLGYLNGITISVADTDGDLSYDTSVSPYFDGEFGEVYASAARIWTGSIA